jgi:hypothetical protein
MFVKGVGQFKANVSGTNQTVLVTRKATRASTLAKVRFPSWFSTWAILNSKGLPSPKLT